MKKKEQKKKKKGTEDKKSSPQDSIDFRYENLLKQIRSNFGETSIYPADSNQIRTDVPVIPTGSIGLNIATGVMGIPRGRVIEIFGPESSGKTTLALEIISQAQRRFDMPVAFVDAEHSLDLKYAANLGVKKDRLLISQPDSGEQALDIVEALAASGQCSVVVIDSVAALVPEEELEGGMGKMQMGLQARLMSKAMRKLVAISCKSNTTLVFINQTRKKIGITWGSPLTTSGGEALKFYSTLRIKIVRIGSTSYEGEKIANKIKVEVVKNKVGSPFKIAEFEIRFGEGIDKIGELLDICCERKVVAKNGAWYSFGGERIGGGIEKARKRLKEDSSLRRKIQIELKKSLKI